MEKMWNEPKHPICVECYCVYGKTFRPYCLSDSRIFCDNQINGKECGCEKFDYVDSYDEAREYIKKKESKLTIKLRSLWVMEKVDPEIQKLINENFTDLVETTGNKSASVTGLDRIADKFKKYFCMSNTCSDGDNNQHPECKIEHCLYRDRIVEDLMEIIKDAV